MDGVPGILFLDVDGLAAPVLHRALGDGGAPTLARWLAEGSHRLLEWETDLSSTAVAGQAGILLGANLDIPALSWVEKERGLLMSCARPADRAEVERRLGDGDGLLRGGGASRGALFAAGAEERGSSGHQAVVADMRRGRPAVYATFADYDAAAHRSGPEAAAALAALRRVDRLLDRIDRARDGAARPYEIVVLSTHGHSRGASFLQRNGYTLADLVNSSLGEGPGGTADQGTAVVLGSGNLGLVYLMESPRRLSYEEIEVRHPRLVDRLRRHRHLGWLLLHSEMHGPVVLGAGGLRLLGSGRVAGDDPLAGLGPAAVAQLRRSDGFAHIADVVVGGFYDAELDESCAFEEQTCFHGGIGGAQTRAFLLAPRRFAVPAVMPVGAAAVGALLRSWRRSLQMSSPARGDVASPSHAGTSWSGAPPVGTGRERSAPFASSRSARGQNHEQGLPPTGPRSYPDRQV